MNVEEYLLNKIFRLSFVPENSPTNIPHRMSIEPEERRKRVAVTVLDACDKNFIVGFGQGYISVRVDAINCCLPIGQRQIVKSGGSRRTQDTSILQRALVVLQLTFYEDFLDLGGRPPLRFFRFACSCLKYSEPRFAIFLPPFRPRETAAGSFSFAKGARTELQRYYALDLNVLCHLQVFWQSPRPCKLLQNQI